MRVNEQDMEVQINAAGVLLEADISVPSDPAGVVVFAHGSGSSRHSPRNQMVARHLWDANFATALADLLTTAEERVDAHTGQFRFDIGLLTDRVVGVIDWLATHPVLGSLPLGLFGASTGAAAALAAAAERPERVRSVVSRGGRPDLAGPRLSQITAPTMLIVGGQDEQVLELNETAKQMLTGVCELRVIPGATHLFSERGALEQVAEAAVEWFTMHLALRSSK
ncbi:MAG: dienelactone hydrolase family protein [Longispora sp.]|nr:dienelactone hydrolase family protein [Longispora sp. (in: high G+C Gram-positive bacteria)]